MSNQSQLAFLQKLQEELKLRPNYRKEIADYKKHNFTLSRAALNRGIKDMLKLEFPEITEAQIKTIRSAVAPQVTKVIKNTATTIETMAKNTPEGVQLISQTINKVRAVFEATGSNRFAKAYSSYADHLDPLLEAVKVAMTETLGKTTDRSKGEIWQLEHFKFEGILESKVKDSIDNALADETEIDAKQLDEFFRSRGISLRVYRDTSTETMKVFLGSAIANKQEGQESKDRRKKLLEELTKAIETLQTRPDFAFITMKGSDSFKTIKRKKTIKKITDPFKKIKDVKVVTEDIKIKHSRTNKTIVNKTKQKTTSRLKRKNLQKTSRTSPASQPLVLLQQINKRLPEVVARNMEAPRLNYKSGRFASSVRATDVIQTPQGYLSIGYTYMKSPYQTFEPGYKQGSADRDPRRLIDQSMREIASQYAIGRFYTRRV